MQIKTREGGHFSSEERLGQVELAASPAVAGLSRSVLLSVSEFALRQLGLPGALTYGGYLAGLCRIRLRRGRWHPSTSHPHDTVPDHERS
jgi:hypothetical protein